MADASNPTDKPDDEPVEKAVLSQVEERPQIEKREIEGQTISVSTRPFTQQETVREEVTKETVTIDRISMNAVIEEIPPIRQEGGLTIIPVVEERLVVTKQLVLVEEIHLRKSNHSETIEEKIALRKTEVEIDGPTSS